MAEDWLGAWVERLGLSTPGQAAILAVAALAFLPVPDVDLWLIRLLHHRSILTHSVLIPALVWVLAPSLGPGAAAGAFLGVAVHLACDALGPSRGYGRVWWPEPFQTSLGGWSRPWLAANAIGGAWLAAVALPPGTGWGRAGLGVGLALALGYGVANERSVLAALWAAAVVAAGFWLRGRIA